MKELARKLVHALRIVRAGKSSLLLEGFGQSIHDIVWCDNRCISLMPGGSPKGNVLLSYINDPFYVKPGQPLPNTHTHFWESQQIATTFLELGYCVDVIRYSNRQFRPAKHYAFAIDARNNLERLAPWLNKDCVKIFHADTAHWLFHNTAQHRRLLELQQRRGITLNPGKTVIPNRGVELADCATVLGNGFTMSTYKFARKPMYRVPISAPVVYPWPEGKDFEACRKRFLWFGSAGLVHKGLDLVLEAFAGMRDYRLTVCGPIDGEKDFEAAYHTELYRTSNIETVGWVDIGSDKFIGIVNTCAGIVYPSCSEGGGGGVITCMHAGLIPIVSYEASVDVDKDYGALLSGCSVEEIQSTVRCLGSLSGDELKKMARRAWEFARAHHTRAKFSEEYRNVVGEIASTHGHRLN